MQIQQGTSSLIVFLLVRQEDGQTSAPGLEPKAFISRNGAGFVPSEQSPVEIGDGWYKLSLTPAETAQSGPLIVRAQSDGTLEWRDIVSVVPVVETGSGGGSNSGGTDGGTDGSGGESGSGSPEGGTDGSGGESGSGSPEGGTGGSEGGSGSPSENLIRNGDFSQGDAEWLFYSNGKAEWAVADGAARIDIERVGSNLQLYQKEIEITSGLYRVRVELSGPTGRRVQVLLHQHNLPRRNLGLNATVALGNGWTVFERTFELGPDETNARLRFWFAAAAKNGDTYRVRSVSIVPV